MFNVKINQATAAQDFKSKSIWSLNKWFKLQIVKNGPKTTIPKTTRAVERRAAFFRDIIVVPSPNDDLNLFERKNQASHAAQDRQRDKK